MKILLFSLIVGLGGFAGSIARYGLSLAFQKYSIVMPLGTIGANIIGCFIIGIIAHFSTGAGVLSPEMRLLLATGFCGGFTTMSSFVYESTQMIKSNELYYAGLYFLITIAGSFLAFFLGLLIAHLIFNRAGNLWN
ncbi:MAG: fluoride efflux transporter CrcB [Victivallales bacterium]|jgi:CrcB protein